MNAINNSLIRDINLAPQGKLKLDWVKALFGAQVFVTEIDPIKVIEAYMDGIL